MIALSFSNLDQRGDFVRTGGGNLDTDEGLETAVTTSLFTDARADESDGIDKSQDQGGWWGEDYLDQPGQYGSRLWLVTRGKLTNEALLQCSAYAKEALQHLIDSRVVASIEAVTTRMRGRDNIALLTLKIQRPSKSAPRFERAWAVQFGI